MSGLKTIRRRISSVKNTKQITRAMKLVSAAKLRRAQDGALNGRLFSERLSDVLSLVAKELPEGFSNPLIEKRREIRKRLVILIAGERGLCGAYNANIIKAAQAEDLNPVSAIPADVVTFGKRASSAARRLAWNSLQTLEGLGEDANVWPIAPLVEKLLAGYVAGEFDELVVYYTKFVSAMTQRVSREVLLPLSPVSINPSDISGSAPSVSSVVTAKFDPRPETILVKLLPFLIAAKIRQAALESKASEHASRMTAMDSATRNADDLISRLRLFYNRARQTAITRELIDIVGGAEAIK